MKKEHKKHESEKAHGKHKEHEKVKKHETKHKEHESKKKEKSSAKDSKVSKVMHEWKEGKLHSGSKKGPEVTNQKQAVAIALSEARKAGQKVKSRK